jgi:hypothetical protein
MDHYWTKIKKFFITDDTSVFPFNNNIGKMGQFLEVSADIIKHDDALE